MVFSHINILGVVPTWELGTCEIPNPLTTTYRDRRREVERSKPERAELSGGPFDSNWELGSANWV